MFRPTFGSFAAFSSSPVLVPGLGFSLRGYAKQTDIWTPTSLPIFIFILVSALSFCLPLEDDGSRRV